MSRKRELALITAGILAGAALVPTAHAAVQHLTAIPSVCAFYLEGQRLESYTIQNRDYIPVDSLEGVFRVSYQPESNTVQISKSGQEVTRYIPQAGDKITCDDGTIYTITDVSRWDKNAFSSGPLSDLPTPTCDWSKLPQPELPRAEARHFTVGQQEYLFMRNLYETRRMLYTLYNAIGDNPETWKDGAPVLFPSGNEKVKIKLSVDPGDKAHSFWPWRAEEIVNNFNSCPPGTYSLEAWDVYKDGVFQRTEYSMHVK